VQTLEGLLDGRAVHRVDPALAKLLKDLPLRDPDEHELAEIWMAHARGKAVVPVGIETEIELGPWRGPTMRLADVELNARNLRTGEQCTCRFGEVGEVPIWYGIYIRLSVLVD
jgi:hypothetical protein